MTAELAKMSWNTAEQFCQSLIKFTGISPHFHVLCWLMHSTLVYSKLTFQRYSTEHQSTLPGSPNKTLQPQPSLHSVLLISQRKLLMYQLLEYLAVNTVLFEELVEELETNLMSLVIFITLNICSTCFEH